MSADDALRIEKVVYGSRSPISQGRDGQNGIGPTSCYSIRHAGRLWDETLRRGGDASEGPLVLAWEGAAEHRLSGGGAGKERPPGEGAAVRCTRWRRRLWVAGSAEASHRASRLTGGAGIRVGVVIAEVH
jgi:hypothetical protein